MTTWRLILNAKERKMQFQKTLPRYSDCGVEYLELHRNHTMWRLNNENLSYQDSEELYTALVLQAIDEFENKTGVNVYLLGRSGRHVCVDDTAENSKRYNYLKKTAKKLENLVVEKFNNCTGE